MCELVISRWWDFFLCTSLFSTVRAYICFHMERDDYNRLKTEESGSAKSSEWCPVLFLALVCVFCCEGQDLLPLFMYCWIHGKFQMSGIFFFNVL